MVGIEAQQKENFYEFERDSDMVSCYNNSIGINRPHDPSEEGVCKRMIRTRSVTDDMVWVGASDRRLALFENIFPVPRGVSYNSYLLLDKKLLLYQLCRRRISGSG